MKLQKLQLKNFKRFSDLTIDIIPPNAKLVLLIGSNGCGKSSVFDAFSFVNESLQNKAFGTNEDYYKKDKTKDIVVELDFGDFIVKFQGKDFEFGSSVAKPNLSSNSFYGRTSFRQTPRLTRTSIGQERFDIEKDSDRPQFFIDKDERFENDIEKISGTILKEFFRTDQSNKQIREKYIEPINKALQNIFGENNGTKLELIEIIPPLEGNVAQVNFRKGTSEIHYNLLSASEKEVVNLLINLLSRSENYQDTVYFFDEIDLHLESKTQFRLLKEITENWIPANCQVWTASHSLGFIEYAKQTENAAIIDFDSYDFDNQQILTPEPKENPDIYEIAVGKEFLPSLFEQMNIYFIEGNDSRHYAQIGIPKTIFVPENDRNNVFHKVRTANFRGIVDRDFLSDDDISEIRRQYKNLIILDYYSIENYLYHPENLAEYYASIEKEFNKNQYIQQLTQAKNEIKRDLVLSIFSDRESYPYFGEPEFNGQSLQNRFKKKDDNMTQVKSVADYLDSDEIETFYKSLPMKDYCKYLPQRQNISKNELAKTKWFKLQVEKLLEN